MDEKQQQLLMNSFHNSLTMQAAAISDLAAAIRYHADKTGTAADGIQGPPVEVPPIIKQVEEIWSPVEDPIAPPVDTPPQPVAPPVADPIAPPAMPAALNVPAGAQPQGYPLTPPEQLAPVAGTVTPAVGAPVQEQTPAPVNQLAPPNDGPGIAPPVDTSQPGSYQNVLAQLNAYGQRHGHDNLMTLVMRYAGGSQQPTDIPAIQYANLLKEIAGGLA